MSTSYKTLWQEASQEIEQLKHRIEQLQEQYRKDMAQLHAFIEDNRSELADTRPIVDLAGIARHMRVERFTPQQWKQRDHLPPVDFPEIKEPLWYVSTIKEQFAIPTRRPWYDHPEEVEEALSPAA